MPIKLKNIPVVEPFDPLQKHLNNIVSPSKAMEYAEKRLKAACAATDLIKKNTDTPEKASKVSDPLKTDDNLTVLSAAIDKTVQVNQETEQTINEYLSNLDNLRKENQLVYGRKLGEFNLSLGLGLVDMGDKSEYPCYKKSLTSTVTSIFHSEQYTQTGAVEFGVTYDNTIFIVPKSEGSVANNLYKMAQGTLLKAVGCIQIGNRQTEESVVGDDTYSVLEGQVNYISVYNAFFDAPKDNITVSLFVLRGLGIDLNDTKVVIPNDNASLINPINSDCNISIRGEIKKAEYYLDETRFPGAKALAEKQLTFFDKIDELFCTIDDEIFVKRNKKFLEEIYGKKELLKLNLIELFNCVEEYINETGKKAKEIIAVTKPTEDINQPSTSFQSVVGQNIEIKVNIKETTGSFNNYWQAIRDSIQFFKEKNSDLSFLVHEINMILAYLLQNSLTVEEKNQLKELTIPARIPGRGLDIENISSYITFYEQDPIKTCMALLKDYSKGDGWKGVIYRFFSGAWQRNYKDPVNKVLLDYSKNELPDNLTICDIYNKLKESGLIFNFDAESKSSLRKILLFCAKLNKEEEPLLDLIHNRSFTSFPPLDQDRQVDCCC
jgi:hypothetical protein